MASNDGVLMNGEDEIDKVNIIQQDIISRKEVSDDPISENKLNASLLEPYEVIKVS